MRAAERCIQRHGIRKTTMDDIAREAGISRPSIYRFFADREELLVALTEEHSRALTARTHKFLARQENFEDALVEGLLYLAEHGNRDPFTRFLVAPQEADFALRIGSTDTAAELSAEFWDPLLDEAERTGQMRTGLDRRQLHIWLANLGLMFMSLLNKDKGATAMYREMIRALVVPAFRPDAVAPSPGKRRAAQK
ncbi:regulatory protein TetR [Mycolicibacterium rhodesiae JS60]|nr:regulatory protein TetR [Mycolicibacterium rhodesiae JS60]